MGRIRYSLCGLCVLIGGCGGGESQPQDPRALVLDYEHALATGDGGRACSDLTPERRRTVVTEDQRFEGVAAGTSCEAVLSKKTGLREAASDMTVEGVEIVGDQATITLNIGTGTRLRPTLSAVKEGGSWKLTYPQAPTRLAPAPG